MNEFLVTGGTGFIGSNLALELQKRYPKANITVMDDFRGSSFKNLLGFKGDFMAYDVSDAAWKTHFKNRPLDAIFHLASITDTTVLDEKKMMYDNVEGFRNILELAAEKKASVVYASSAAVYGSHPAPTKESDAGMPNNIYGFSKWIFEGLAEQYAGRVKAVGLRYFNVFGPGETFKGTAASMIYQLYLQIKAGKRPRIFKYGEQKRDFVYVLDVVNGTIGALSAKNSTVVNIGSGAATTFNEVIDTINETLGTGCEPDYFDNPYDFYQENTEADLTHATKAIGYKPRYSTSDGIAHYIKNYLTEKESPSKKLLKK